MLTYFNLNEVQDSIGILGFDFNSKEIPFFDFELKGLGLSYQDDIKGIDPPLPYKIAGFSVFRNLHKTSYSRTSYSILAIVGDFGAFVEGWMILCSILIFAARINSTDFFMRRAFYTSRSQTFAKQRTTKVAYLSAMLRKIQGENELDR